MKHSTIKDHIDSRNAKAAGLLKRAGYNFGGMPGMPAVMPRPPMAGPIGAGTPHTLPIFPGQGPAAQRFKKGGKVSGKMPKAAGHKKTRGHHVNIIIGANQGEKQEAARQGMATGAKLGAMMMAKKLQAAAGPPPMAAPAPMGPRPMPPVPPHPMMGAAPPMGAPPMGGGPMKKGGAVKVRAYSRGGVAKSVPKMKGGSGGGQGRIAKSIDYGAGSSKVRSHLRSAPHKRGGKT